MTVSTTAPERAPAPPPPPSQPPSRPTRAASVARHVLLALAAYVPLLFTARGRVAADTKTYLYLDPTRLLERAPWMWDPNIGFGTVTHQNIGYLFPMGPWYWTFDALGVPDWVAQRLWLGTVLFAAGAGVLFLLRSLGWRHDGVGDDGADDAAGRSWLVRLGGGGALAAAAVYMLSPFVLENAARFSVLLLPWAGLPWLVGLTQRALRTGSWRHPALFALVVTVVGGVNATALVLAGIGPLLWVPFAVWVHRDVNLRRALAAVARIGLLTLGCSLWWMAGLAIQGSYGIEILRYTETVKTVAGTSLASEVMRGLGYWFFYGGDKVDPWIEPSSRYMQSLWLIGVTFALPALAVIAAAVTRWRYRAYFVALLVVGTAVAVGAYPYDDPSPLGALFKAAARSSTAGLAMRSTARAAPLVILGVAVLLAAGLGALSRRVPRRAAIGTALVALLAVAAIPPLWSGHAIGRNLQRPEDIPEYWEEAAAYLDSRGDATRVLEIPGSDFASYRWGTTVDPITPGLMDRPYVARELIPYGSPPSADLLIALDRRLQEDQLDPAVLAPLARLMGVGDIAVRSDLQYERFNTTRPRALWAVLDEPVEGLGRPVTFGEPRPNRAIARLPLTDQEELAIPEGTGDPPPVAVFPVEDPVAIVRAHTAARSLLLAGDGEGVVQAAAAGVLEGEAPLFYAAALAGEPELRERLLGGGADLVITDTNRKRGRRWSTLWENGGATEQAGSEPLDDDITDNRLPVFPEAGDDSYTTVEQRGVRQVVASNYGNPVTFTPENRPANALDGDLETAWRVGDFSPVGDERLRIDLEEPVTTDHVEVVQPTVGDRNRYITQLEVRLDGDRIGTFDLGESSRTRGGQRLDIGEQTFSRLELVVRGDNIGPRRRYNGLSPVGFAEVRVDGVRVDEVVRLPSDLLAAAGARSADSALDILLERVRSNPLQQGRRDEELSMVRAFELPTSRSFTIAGDARLSAYADEDLLDSLLGIPGADEGGVTATSSAYVQGLLSARAHAAIDGDRTTAWQTPFGEPNVLGSWIQVEVPEPVTVDHLDVSYVVDGQHSVPKTLRIEGEDGESRIVDVPSGPGGDEQGATATVRVDFDPLTTARLRVTVEDVERVLSNEYYSEQPTVRPIGIAELGIPGVQGAAAPERFPETCHEDLLEVDGRPVGVRLVGSTADAEARNDLSVEVCGDGAAALELGRGDHLLRAAQGKRTGIDLDRLALHAEAGRAPGATAAPPTVEVTRDGRSSMDVEVHGAAEPFWLVLGQSVNDGWTASVDGGDALGHSKLIDGYANGWYVDPQGRSDFSVSLEWEPQRGVWLALALSAAFLLLCLGIALVGWWRAREAVPAVEPAGAGAPLPELVSPLSFPRGAGRLRPVAAAFLALGAGVVSAVLVTPLVGVAVLAVVALALRMGRRGRTVLTLGAVAAFLLAAAYVLAKQAWKGGVGSDFTWPSAFHASHNLAWVAILLLATDVVVELVLRSGRRTAAPPPPASGG
jgi:arabinofuranan 3-O-arabinosyltransferase